MFVYNVGLSSSSREGRVLADGVEDKRSASPSLLRSLFLRLGRKTRVTRRERCDRRRWTRLAVAVARRIRHFPCMVEYVISVAQTRFVKGKHGSLLISLSVPRRIKFV